MNVSLTVSMNGIDKVYNGFYRIKSPGKLIKDMCDKSEQCGTNKSLWLDSWNCKRNIGKQNVWRQYWTTLSIRPT